MNLNFLEMETGQLYFTLQMGAVSNNVFANGLTVSDQ